ncbi:uncharacterized protein LOC133318355 [Gastrolobium bilobum]|uniref:uncharacterized protein LOC133318355 n=1 Tax=Gastrolobium bilobum TaxID=150636 RepID=UPI002AB20DB7|nr:uncharacterized protein LOC133318355 [Gastrolobium bilobum]
MLQTKSLSQKLINKWKKFSNATINIVSLTEIFTSNQIKEHIMSLRKQFIQNTSEEETGMDANTCHLCSMQKLFFEGMQDKIGYRGYSRTTRKNESMAFHTITGKSLQSESSNLLQSQHLSREISDVSNLFPVLTSSSSLGDIRQCQPQKLNFQQNFKHLRQQYELRDKASMAQPSSYFVVVDCILSEMRVLYEMWKESNYLVVVDCILSQTPYSVEYEIAVSMSPRSYTPPAKNIEIKIINK